MRRLITSSGTDIIGVRTMDGKGTATTAVMAIIAGTIVTDIATESAVFPDNKKG